MKNKIFKKLFKIYILKRIYLERLGEPFIYNIISLFVLIFGNIRLKIKYDLVPRESYAYGILAAADLAKSHNINKISIIEFGVASGNGLLNMCYIANKVTKLNALCKFCKNGTEAPFTKRLSRSTKQHLVGGEEEYASVCRFHYDC